ncbi:hypothetical protein [Streptomyces sp. NPDC002537]
MYTLLFLLILVCVVALLRGWSLKPWLWLWSGTLALTFLAFLPHLDRTFHLGL